MSLMKKFSLALSLDVIRFFGTNFTFTFENNHKICRLTSVVMGISAMQHRVAIGGNRPPDINPRTWKRKREHSQKIYMDNMLAVTQINHESSQIWACLFLLLSCLTTVALVGLQVGFAAREVKPLQESYSSWARSGATFINKN